MTRRMTAGLTALLFVSLSQAGVAPAVAVTALGRPARVRVSKPQSEALISPSRRVAARSLQGLRTSAPHLIHPFLPRDPDRYASAKAQTGSRTKVAAGSVNRRTPGGPTYTFRGVTSFLTDVNRQVSYFGQDQSLEPPDPQLAAGP